MSDAMQQFIDAVEGRIAMEDQIRKERAEGRGDVMSTAATAKALLLFMEQEVRNGEIPEDYGKDVADLHEVESQIEAHARQAERSELS